MIVTSEPQFWALVDFQPALSEVGVGLKVLGAAGGASAVWRAANNVSALAASGAR